MKSKKSICLLVIALLALLAPLGIAQNNQDRKHNEHHHYYKVIDLGTFGGPQSYLDALPAVNQIVNKQGAVAGYADTSTPDPFPSFCFNPDCFVSHAFQWEDGVLTDLGTLATGWSSSAFWITDTGQIAGNSQNGEIDPLLGIPEFRAVRWQNGRIANLGTLEGGYESLASAVNNRGQVAGIALNTIPDPFCLLAPGFCTTQSRAFLWQNGVMQDLGTLGGPDAEAFLINQGGQIAGMSYTSFTANPNNGPFCTANVPTIDPFLWKDGNMIDLGSLGGACGYVAAMNDKGQVAGGSSLPGDQAFHPTRWVNGALTDLGTFGGNNGFTNWISASGDVVGAANFPDNITFHAALWKDGAMVDIGTVPGDACSSALVINSRDEIVGNSGTCDGSVSRAVLWNRGAIFDLNTLIPPNSGLYLNLALYINDRGEIAGQGATSAGDNHAFLLIPCDEKHAGVEGCDYSMMKAPTAVAQPRPALLKPSRQVPSRTLSSWRSRYRGTASCTGGNRAANDRLDSAMPSNPAESGFCGVNINDTLTGECIGGGGTSQCSEQYDKRQCPPGKKAIAPTNSACGYKEVVTVDGARHCPLCGGRCGLGCGPGCACGKDGMCHRAAHKSLKEALWNPQP
jgi:probable HAF family extracellular repeat protein